MSDLTLEALLETPQRFAAWLRSQDGTVTFQDTPRACPLACWIKAERGPGHLVTAHGAMRTDGFGVVPLRRWGVEFIDIFDDLAIQNGNIERWWVFASEITAHLDSHPPDWWQETQQ